MPDGSAMPRLGTGLLNPANIVTFFRLCAVPVAVWLLLRHSSGWAFALFVAAGVSDAIDGWLARRFGGSAIGAALDPIADKALLVCMYVTLAATGLLPSWIAILVVFRDLLIVGGLLMLWVTGHPVAIRPLAISKFNTAMQIVLIGAVLGVAGFGIVAHGAIALLLAGLIWMVAATTLASGGAYVRAVARG